MSSGSLINLLLGRSVFRIGSRLLNSSLIILFRGSRGLSRGDRFRVRASGRVGSCG